MLSTAYKVRLVDDHELPAEHDWAIIREEDLVTVVIVRSAISEKTLEDAWAGYRHAVAEGISPRLRLVG